VAKACRIEIYSTVGQLLNLLDVEEGFTTIPVVDGNNVVIVKVGNSVEKVIVK
jgi:hypothetical protein